MNGERYQHALAMHPRSNGTARATYRLDGNFSEFSTRVGICETAPSNIGKSPTSSLAFQVFGDGRLLAEKKDVKIWGTAYPLTTNVANVQTLTLRVLCDGTSSGAWATWLNPTLRR